MEHFEHFEETLTPQCDFNGMAVGKAPRLGQTLCVPKDVGPSRFLRFLRHSVSPVLISASDDEIVCALPNTTQQVAPFAIARRGGRSSRIKRAPPRNDSAIFSEQPMLPCSTSARAGREVE